MAAMKAQRARIKPPTPISSSRFLFCSAKLGGVFTLVSVLRRVADDSPVDPGELSATRGQTVRPAKAAMRW